MESKLVVLLNRLHSDGFSDAKSLCESIADLALEQTLPEHILAFINNQLFVSALSIQSYVDKTISQKDGVSEDARKLLYNMIGDCIKLRGNALIDYIGGFFKMAQHGFTNQISSKCKEASLRITKKLIKHIENYDLLRIVIKPTTLCGNLLEHLKCYKPTPTIQGCLWHILGLICRRFTSIIQTKVKEEIQDLCLKQLEKYVKSEKNFGVISCILKSFNETLSQNYLEPALLNKVFIFIKVLMNPVRDSYEVPRSALQVLTNHANLFHQNLMANAKEIFNCCIQLMAHKNKELKLRASETSEAISLQFVNGISNDPIKYDQLYKDMMTKLWQIIKEQSNLIYNTEKKVDKKNFETATRMVSVIRMISNFSPLIISKSGKDQLRWFFQKMLQICQKKMVKSFDLQEQHRVEGSSGSNRFATIKNILYHHKQIFSFIGSFARIIGHLQDISYAEAEGLYHLFLLAIRQYPFYYDKYVPQLIKSLVSLIMAVSNISQLYTKWLKKAVMSSLKDCLDGNRFMVAVDEDYLKMIGKACTLWTQIISQSQWTNSTLNEFASVLFECMDYLIKNLDVSYASVVEKDQENQKNQITNIFSKDTDLVKPANISDFQYMTSLVLLFDHLLTTINGQLYFQRVFGLYTDVLRKIKLLPKSIALMKVCRTLNDFITRENYLCKVNQSKSKQLVPCIQSLFEQVYENTRKYQGQMLYEALKLLMSVPIEVVQLADYRILKNQLPQVMLRSLQLGQEIPSLAHCTLKCLEYLFSKLQKKILQKLLEQVIQQFDKYLIVKQGSKVKEVVVTNFVREQNLTQEQIRTQTISFFGRMGGFVHLMVPDLKSRQTKERQLEQYKKSYVASDSQYISWDHDCSLTFALPLISRKIDLKITKLLSRVIQLMLEGASDSIKVAACELMHAVIIYIIGKSASDPKRNMSEAQLLEQNSFKERCSKIYGKILPGVFRVGYSRQHPSHQLMHTLSIQLIHFLSKTHQPNSPDIIVLLKILGDMLPESNDACKFATKCIAEFVKWNIKQQVDNNKDFPLVKMVIRSLWTLTTSRNVKEGTVPLITEILRIIHREESLMCRFILQFCSLILTISKNNNPVEPNLTYLIDKIVLSMKPHVKQLAVQNYSGRMGKFSSIQGLLDWLYETGLFSSFSQQRKISFPLWQKILTSYSTLLDMNVQKFIYNRADKHNKVLFTRIRTQDFNEAADLKRHCSTLSGYSELWHHLIEGAYFELNYLIQFTDFRKYYIDSCVSFLNLLCNISNKTNIIPTKDYLDEAAQQQTLECFVTMVQLFKLLLAEPATKDAFLEQLLERLNPESATRLLISMLLKPHQVIMPVSSDLIMTRYPTYFHDVSTVLSTICQRNLSHQINVQYKALFGYENQEKSIFQVLSYSSELFDNQLLLFFKGHAELNKLLQTHEADSVKFVQILTMIERLMEQNKKDISSERCLMLTRFILENINTKAVSEYVLDRVCQNSLMFQKNQKIFLNFVVRNWESQGQQLVAKCLVDQNKAKTLMGLLRLLPKSSLQSITEWLPKFIKQNVSAHEIMEEVIKINFVIVSECKVLSDDYKRYVGVLLQYGLARQNPLSLHECSINLLSELLIYNDFKTAFLNKFKRMLIDIRQVYVPLLIRNLQDEKSKSQFKTFLKTFRNLLIISKQISLFEILFKILKEKVEGYFKNIITGITDSFIGAAFANKESAIQENMITWTFDRYLDEKLDNNWEENSRVAIGDQLLRKLIDNASELTILNTMDEYLPKLSQILKNPVKATQPESVALELSLKRTVFSLVEAIYNKMPQKGKGPQKTYLREHHKELIRHSEATVKNKEEFESNMIKYDTENGGNKMQQIMRTYRCAAYNCLSILFIKTQSNKTQFKAYLFDKKEGQKLWQNIIDTTTSNLGFQVETSFEMMKPVEHSVKPITSKIKNKYFNSSLFTIQEEFVPKTLQLDELEAKEDKMEVQKSMNNQPTLELDIINQHPCMSNVLRLIDHLSAQFPQEGMPIWMESLYNVVINEPVPIAVRVFIIKLVLNRPKIFTHQVWLGVLLNYLGLKERGSKGFHYFYRDVCRQVIAFKTMGYKSEGRVVSTAVNRMVTLLPHENGMFFAYNLQQFEEIAKFAGVYLEEGTVSKLLVHKNPNSENESVLWRLTGVLIVKIAIAIRVPILKNYEELIKATTHDDKFRFVYKLHGMLGSLWEFLSENKKQHSVAVAGLLGQLIKFLNEKPTNQKEMTEKFVASNLIAATASRNRSLRERVPLILHEIVQIYPPFLKQSKVQSVAQSEINAPQNPGRSFILKCYSHLFDHMKNKRAVMNQVYFRVALVIRAAIGKIAAESGDSQRQFIILLLKLTDLTALIDKNIYSMFHSIYELLATTYVLSTQEQDSLGFFNITIKIHDFHQSNNVDSHIKDSFSKMIKKYLVSGLSSSHPSVKKLIFSYFQDEKKQINTTIQRLLDLFDTIYFPEHEELWLTSAVPLMIALSKRSSDYDRLLFEQSLDKLANYYDWDFRNHIRDNTSQPYTPAYTLLTQAMKKESVNSQDSQSSNQLQGMLRASQNSYLIDSSPVFTQIQQQPSQMASQEAEMSQPSNVPSQLVSIFKTMRKKPYVMKDFLASNSISYNNITVAGNNVRFNKQKPGEVFMNYEETLNKQTQLYLKRANQKFQRGTFVRKYKIGELPDIQITSRDLIDPLIALAFNDSQLSAQLFSQLLTCLCKTQSKSHLRQFAKLIPQKLNESVKKEYDFVTTMQRSLITLVKEMQEPIEFHPLSIAIESNSYEHSILFVEENLIQLGNIQRDISVPDSNPQEEYWFDLLELYHRIYNTDEVQGILLKVMNKQERQQFTDILNLKKRGLNEQAKRTIQNLLLTISNSRIKRIIQSENIDCDTLMCKWQPINKQLAGKQRSEEEDRLYITSIVNLSKPKEDIKPQLSILKQFNMDKTESLFYERALLHLACKGDADEAKFLAYREESHFLEAWSKLSSFAIRSKHQLLQVVQRNYQLKQFLDIYSRVKITVLQCQALFDVWTRRNPHIVHDGHANWLLALESRLLYLRLLQDRYKLSDDIVIATSTEWYAQIGLGMIKKGVLGIAHHLFRKALAVKKNSPVFPWNFYKSTAKMKLKQLLMQHEPRVTQNPFVEFEHFPNIIRKEMVKFDQNGQQVSVEVKLQMNILEVKFYEAFLDQYSILLRNPGISTSLIDKYADIINNGFKILKETCVNDLIKNESSQEHLDLKRKTFRTLTLFSQRLLSMLEEPYEIKALSTSLTRHNLQIVNVSKIFAQSLIRSLQLMGIQNKDGTKQHSNSQHLSSLILKLLKVVQRHSEQLGDLFVNAVEEKKVPVWLFLYFIPQMVSILNLECSRYFEKLFIKICELYPQALIYQFNSQFQRQSKCKTDTSRRIFELLHQNHPVNFLFIEALDHLNHPEFRFRDSLYRLREKDTFQDSLTELEDFISPNPYYGKYNKKYTEEREAKIKKIISQCRTNDRAWMQEVKKILQSDEMRKVQSKSYLTLSDFSLFFDEYASSDMARILVPGQYSGCGIQPNLSSQVQIQNFEQTMLALSSQRKPKRITIYGNNEKKYMMLVKGGEDLRLDQRIEQVFSVINDIMSKNSECQKRQLYLRRFEVVPMKRWTGILEWVDNTQVLRQFLDREFKEIKGKDCDLFMKNRACETRMEFLSTLSNANRTDRALFHRPLLTCNDKDIIMNFKKCQFMMPYGLLRRALERLAKNFDSYLHLKNRFIANYAVTSVASYLLGIGDRHLDNFLIHIPTATTILIDFGYSFGASLELPIPQLMPFRLTKVFCELMDPIGLGGAFKACMVHSIDAMRNKWHQLIDFCEVFVNDPVLDFSSMNHKKKIIRRVDTATSSTVTEEIEEEPIFKKKIEFLRKKLQGYNPRYLLSEALGESKHKNIPSLKKVVEGSVPLKTTVLSASEQVDVLIEMAIDKNILGRTFTPWCPYI